MRPDFGLLDFTCRDRKKLKLRRIAEIDFQNDAEEDLNPTLKLRSMKFNCSLKGMKDKEQRKLLPAVQEKQNIFRVCSYNSFTYVGEQPFESEKEQITVFDAASGFPINEGSKKSDGLSDTFEKAHSQRRKRVAIADLPPEELRCIRSDGRSWRCNARALPGGRRCQKHHLQLIVAQERQQLNKGSASVRIPNGKTKLRPSDFGIKAEEFLWSRPPNQTLHEKLLKKFLRNPLKLHKKKSLYFCNTNKEMNILPINLRTSGLKGKPFGKSDLTSKRPTKSSPDVDLTKFDQGKLCHHCQRNDKGAILLCLKCNRRRYCLCCVTRWYPDLSQQEIIKACPFCRGRCVCKVCLQSKEKGNDEIPMIKSELLKCLQYLLASILPFLKRFNEDQFLELELETALRGAPISNLVHAPMGSDDWGICDNCGTSIVDFHRSCPECDYDLCLTCCQELRQGKQPGAETPISLKLFGQDSSEATHETLKNKKCPTEVLPCSRREESFEKAIKEASSVSFPSDEVELAVSQTADKSTVWRANEDGTVPCAPAERGCGSPVLMLTTWHRANYLDNLVKEVDCLIDSLKIDCEQPAINDSENASSSVHDCSSLRLAAQRSNTNDNYIFAPLYEDAKAKGIQHFQRHWVCGEPIIVKNVHKIFNDVSWEPMALWKAAQGFAKSYLDEDSKLFTTVDYFNLHEVDVDILEFLKGYEVGYVDHNDWPKMMRSDWFPGSIFEERLPNHCAKFISCLPFPEYTHPVKGILNLAAKFPERAIKADLGPKLYITYGVSAELDIGDSVTKLQCSASDMVSVLVHTSVAKLTPRQWKRAHCVREKHESGIQACQNIGHLSKVYKQQGLERFAKAHRIALLKNSAVCGLRNSEDGELHVALELNDMDRLHNKKTTFSSRSSFMDNPVFGKDKRKWETEAAVESNDSVSSLSEETKMKQINSSEQAKQNALQFPNESDDLSLAANYPARGAASGGAVWDVFRQKDILKLQEYLRKHSKDFKCHGSSEVVHPIHDQSFFLNEVHKKRLKQEFQIEPWTFEQNLGEAVLIPAGCPYQVKYLKSCTKIALDFVSPESLQESRRITEEYRLLPRNHHAKEDKLQVNNMILHTASEAMTEIKRLITDNR